MLILATCFLLADARLFDPGQGPSSERALIQRHLAYVEATLRVETPATLPPDRRAARERALTALHDYWTAGVFPRNRDYPDRRVPYFIDADGTACAVGQLMIASGASWLAREIATYENNDFLADIDHPGVAGWLFENGLRADEAAWIQPTYGPCGFEAQQVCGVDGKTYLCKHIADCAGVHVAHDGECGGTGSSSDSGGDGEVVETCENDDDKKGCSVVAQRARPPTSLFVLMLLLRRRSRTRSAG